MRSEVSKSNTNVLVGNYFFLENYFTSEGAVSHNVLYYQQLSITRYQVRFYANNYFEKLPIVSTAFKGHQYFIFNLQHPLMPGDLKLPSPESDLEKMAQNDINNL